MGLDRNIDITAKQRKTVLALLARHLPNTTAWVYGSRAKWTSRPQSDLDVVVFATPEQSVRVGELREAFEDSDLPFRVDLFVWDAVPEKFQERIETDHVVLVGKENLRASDTWQKVSVEEIADKVAMGPFGSSIKVNTFVPEGVPIISGQHLHRIRVDDAPGFNFITPEHADRLASSNVRRGDVVFTHAGNIGQVAYIPEGSRFDRYVISQRQFYMRCNPTKAISEFLALYFTSPEGQHQLLANASQVGVPSIAQPVTYLRTIEVPLPPLPEQRAIAHILGTLDDKIELNRRMNETLEAMARALFKSWFVDFDPVRAKMEDRDLGLPPHLADLFPARLVNSELGEIPEGWEVVPLSKIMDFKEGPGIRHWQYTNSVEGTRFINIRCIQDGDLLLSTSNRITTEEADDKYAHFHLREWDIVVSSSGTLGRSAVVRKAHLPLLLNTSVIRFRSVGGITSFSYLYGYLNSSVFLDELRSLASGSVQENFGPIHLKTMRVLCPPYNCIERYEEIAGSFHQEVITKRTCNDALASLRDVLLPPATRSCFQGY